MARDTLGIDAHRLLGARAGVGRYLASILDEWTRQELPFERITLFTPRPLPDTALPAEHPFTVRVIPQPVPGAWHHLTLAKAANETDLLFCPSYVAPLAYRGPYVVTTHDALHELLAGTFPWYTRYRALLYRRSAERAVRVLTVSDSAKNDLQRLYKLDPAKVHSISSGVVEGLAGATAAEQRDVRERYDLGDDRLVLFVGKFSKRRNLPMLIDAFARVRASLGAGHTLVLVGSNHLGLPLEEHGRRLGLGRALRVLGYVPDHDVRGLYGAASVFVYPSDGEGFGLPVVEAMAAGTPVITLANSSLQEIGAGAALLLPSATVDGLADAIVRLITDDDLNAHHAALGRERARRFSWAETARGTMEVLAQAAEESAPVAQREPA